MNDLCLYFVCLKTELLLLLFCAGLKRSYIKEEDRPKLLEDRVLRKIDRSKREEVTEKGGN